MPEHADMNTIPTIEELDRIGCEASGLVMELPINSEGVAYLTTIRDAVVSACRPQFRPIAEMPEEVPEGCVRLFGFFDEVWAMSERKVKGDTHYIDIALPADTYPPEFEQAWEQNGKPEPKSAAYALWKGGER